MAGLFKCNCEILDGREWLLRVLRQAAHNHSLNSARHRRQTGPQWWRQNREVFGDKLYLRPLEGQVAAQPLIRNNRQGILIAGREELTLNLLWCCIGHCTKTAICL